jgi:hypothetical protein
MHTLFKSSESKTNSSRTNTSNQTQAPEQSGDFSFFPGGIYIAKHLKPSELHKNALNKLMEGYTKTVKLEKIHHKANVYSIRASKGARIMGVCAPCFHQNNQSAFFVFAFFDQHQYKDLKFSNVSTLSHPVVDLDYDSEDTSLINQALDKIPEEGSIPKEHWCKAHYINRQVICFSDQQQDIIHFTSLPVIVTGAAGSGKTLIIIKILQNLVADLQNTQNPNYIYIAPTENLAKEAQKIFNGLLLQNNQTSTGVSFVSLEQFIKLHKPEHQKLTNRQDLHHWLSNNSFHAQFKKLLSNMDYLIEEFKTAAIMTKEQYLKLGKLQSLYSTTEDKKLCYELYTIYKKQNANSCQILFPELKKNKPQYDMVIIDEGQNYTIKQLMTLIGCAKDGKFMVFGDPLQNFTNKISVFPQLKQILQCTYLQKEPLKKLQTAYRNPLPVIHFANDIITIRRLLSDGVDDECEALQLMPSTNATTHITPVEWITTLNQTNIKELITQLSQPETMIITMNEHHLNQAQQVFTLDPVILYPEYIQGLEAKTVFVYCPFTPETIKKINNHLKQIDINRDPTYMPGNNTLGTPEFTADMNKFFTAVTRVAQEQGKLIVYIGEHAAHHSELFIKLLKRSISAPQTSLKESQVVSTESIPTNTKAWEKWIKDLYDTGHESQAKVLYVKHINKDVSEFDKLVEDTVKLENPLISTIVNAQPESTSTPISQKSRRTNAPTVSKTSSVLASTKPSSQDTVLSSLSNLVFTSSDKYIHQLLEQCTLEKLAKFFSNKHAKDYLFYKYKQKNGKQDKTLFETLLNNPATLNVLNRVIDADPFATLPIVQGEETTISIIKSSLSCVLAKEYMPRYELLDQLVEHQPTFLNLFTIELVRLIAVEDLLHTPCCLNLVHRLAFFYPQPLIEVIQENSNNTLYSKHNDLWCIQLLKSAIGCSIITELYRKYTDLFKHINPKALIQELTKKRPDETPLFFWLNTSKDGQLLFKQIISQYPEIKHSITTKVLLSRFKNNTHRYNGTNMIFWLLHGEPGSQALSALKENNTKLNGMDSLIEKEQFIHPDNPEKFILVSDLQQLIKKTFSISTTFIHMII